ncbi:hypothetical protein ACFFQW_47430 [Umezawaea endophytica]|uniref:Uncharacterized protein n=1 Tax=Umezawaea endophytica TaxID=1654476 RepID=A0A9X2ZZR3_9PSEU|nr:hypothetical protein [Umezawaea endophytica]MCS7477749.1 hypothetical protein [Umezawaea endophytica]
MSDMSLFDAFKDKAAELFGGSEVVEQFTQSADQVTQTAEGFAGEAGQNLTDTAQDFGATATDTAQDFGTTATDAAAGFTDPFTQR